MEEKVILEAEEAKEAKEYFTQVRKRDGRIVVFDKSKIADAIFKAAQAVGGEDRLLAKELADAVTFFLRKKFGPRMPSIEEIQDVVEKVLIETGHAKTAKAYILYRARRARIREGLKVRKEIVESSSSTDLSLLVAPSSRDEVLPWDKGRIARALIKEAGLEEDLAYKIASCVEAKVLNSGIQQISTTLIRELVNNELFERGLRKKLIQQAVIGMPTYDLRQLIFSKSNENSNITANNPEAINLAIAENTIKQFLLSNVFSPEVSNAHLKGAIHIHDLGYPRVYSFYKGETFLIRKNGWVNQISFEDLYNSLADVFYMRDGMEIKDVKDIEVYDHTEWVGLRKVMRHRTNKRMLFIKCSNGSSVIVTPDHPMIKKMTNGEELIPAQELREGDELFYFSSAETKKVSSINLAQEFIEAGVSDRYVVNEVAFNYKGTKNKLNNIPLTKIRELIDQKFLDYSDLAGSTISNFKGQDSLPTVLSLSKELGWLIGFFIAEGNYEEWSLGFTTNNITRLIQILDEFGISYTTNRRSDADIKRIRIYSKLLVDLFQNVFNIGKYAYRKVFPRNFLCYDGGFSESILAGIIDGDGTLIRSKLNEDSYRRVNIRMTSCSVINQIRALLESKGYPYQVRVQKVPKPRMFNGALIEPKKLLHTIVFPVLDTSDFCMSEKVRDKSFIHTAPVPKSEVEIIQIKEVKNDSDYVYDVETESGTFNCNGILTHNCSSHSLEYLKKYGLKLENSEIASSPAKYARTLTGHLNTFLASMQAYYAGALGIAYLNIFYAPYFVGMDYNEIKQEAQYLIFSLSQSAFSRGGQVLFIDANIHTGVPSYLRDVPAIGPGGKYTGKTYGHYVKEARDFARALMDVWREGDRDGRPFTFPKADFHISDETFKDPEEYELLRYACQIASENGSPYFVFDRGDGAVLSQCCRLRERITDKYMIEHPESLRFCGFQNVTINLPQAAYRAGRGNIDGLYAEINKAMDLAFKAHYQKKEFIHQMMKEPGMPLWEVGKIAKDGRPYVDLEKATYIIGIIGLNECVQYLAGRELHEDDETLKLGLKIISFMYFKAKDEERKSGLKFSLEESPAESATRRLSKVDLRQFPESRAVIKGDIENDEMYYTNSIHLRADAPVDLITRIEKQSKFHTMIESGSILHAFIGEERPSPESILNLVRKTYENTNAAQLTISPEFTICNSCGRVGRGLKETCSACGSEDIYGITRVVGYYSRVDNWNLSKIGELRDRQRGNYRISS